MSNGSQQKYFLSETNSMKSTIQKSSNSVRNYIFEFEIVEENISKMTISIISFLFFIIKIKI